MRLEKSKKVIGSEGPVDLGIPVLEYRNTKPIGLHQFSIVGDLNQDDLKSRSSLLKCLLNGDLGHLAEVTAGGSEEFEGHRLVALVCDVGSQPAFYLIKRLIFSQRIIGELILIDLADVEIA